VVSREGRVQGVELINNRPHAKHRAVNAVLHDAYRVQFAPAQARGDAVAVSMVWFVANTTVKGRAEDIEMLRKVLRAKTTPQPIGPLPIPGEVDTKPQPAQAPLMKPIVPETSLAALAAGG
jgi:hypothetical protein